MNTDIAHKANLFAYGTLMCSDILYDVTGEKPRSCKARLDGFLRSAIEGENFPGITPAHGQSVEGVLFYQLGKRAWHALDAFEGEMYYRTQVSVYCAKGASVHACAYVIKPFFERRLSKRSWNFDHFVKTQKTRFRRFYSGFDALEL